MLPHELPFSSAPSYQSIRNLSNSAKKISEICDAYDPNLSPDIIKKSDLEKIIFLSEKSALTGRKSIENALENETEIHHDSAFFSSDFLKNSGQISFEFSEKTFKIFTPVTLKKSEEKHPEKTDFTLAAYVRAAAIEWEKENKKSLYRIIQPPFIMIICRRAKKINRTVADNDNLENGRISNTIMNAIGVSDAAVNLSVYSCVKLAESGKTGTEFILFEKKEIASHLSDF